MDDKMKALLSMSDEQLAEAASQAAKEVEKAKEKEREGRVQKAVVGIKSNIAGLRKAIAANDKNLVLALTYRVTLNLHGYLVATQFWSVRTVFWIADSKGRDVVRFPKVGGTGWEESAAKYATEVAARFESGKLSAQAMLLALNKIEATLKAGGFTRKEKSSQPESSSRVRDTKTLNDSVLTLHRAGGKTAIAQPRATVFSVGTPDNSTIASIMPKSAKVDNEDRALLELLGVSTHPGLGEFLVELLLENKTPELRDAMIDAAPSDLAEFHAAVEARAFDPAKVANWLIGRAKRIASKAAQS